MPGKNLTIIWLIMSSASTINKAGTEPIVCTVMSDLCDFDESVVGNYFVRICTYVHTVVMWQIN